MINPLDKLFKEKLAAHSQAPSMEAWRRVEAGLSKKNNGLIWFRMAAAVLLIGAIAGGTAWLTSRTDAPGPLTQKLPGKAEHPQAKGAVKKEINLQPQSVIKNKKTSTPPVKVPVVPEPKVPPQAEFTSNESVAQSVIVTPDPTQSMQLEPVEHPVVITLTLEGVNSSDKPKKPVVIEYRLPSVETEGSQAVAGTKGKSGFRKVIDFALDAKNSTPMADLRDAKEELFAFNFKKEKQKNAK